MYTFCQGFGMISPIVAARGTGVVAIGIREAVRVVSEVATALTSVAEGVNVRVDTS